MHKKGKELTGLNRPKKSKDHILLDKNGKTISAATENWRDGKNIQQLFEDETQQEEEIAERNREGDPDITKEEICMH